MSKLHLRLPVWEAVLPALFASSLAISAFFGSVATAASYPAWVEGNTYKAGDMVMYNGNLYKALVYQTDWVGANWNPAASPTLWVAVGNVTPAPTPTPDPVPAGTCTSVWDAQVAYTSGMKAGLNSILYKANWWTKGNRPDTSSGGPGSGQPWTAVSYCDGTPLPVTPDPTPNPPNPNPPNPPNPQPVSNSGTTGTINFHLLLGVSSSPSQDQLVLDGDNYTDLVMSNIVAGVMNGHLIQEGYPGIQFNKDYLYGSILGQLLQENLATEYYTSGSNLIDPSPNQVAVMGVGQGGPYQINNYAADMLPGGNRALVNYVALQGSIGYTVAQGGAQVSKPTPASFNNKYFGPILTAYFHYNDMVAISQLGKGEGGWQTSWQPAFDNSVANFKTLPNGFLDILLNVAYNQGYYGGLLARYSVLGATATPTTVTAVNSYSGVWGKSDSYEQYPYQVRYYLDQFYDNPVPTTSPASTTTPQNHVMVPMSQLQTVFGNVFATLSYQNPTGNLAMIPSATAQTAFASALTANGLTSTSTLDLSQATDRAEIFAVLEQAITGLETSLGTSFIATSASEVQS